MSDFAKRVDDLICETVRLARELRESKEKEAALLKAFGSIKGKCDEMRYSKEYEPYSYKSDAISKIVEATLKFLGIEGERR